MSLLPHSFFPRTLFDMDDWMRIPTTFPTSMMSTMPSSYMSPLSTMDLYDPFDELDTVLGRNVHWLTRPEHLISQALQLPRVPQKYRISIDCAGFSPSSIKTEFKDGNKLAVWGCEETKQDQQGDYSKREFRKTYELPTNIEKEKMVSFMTSAGNKLIIEFPLKETKQFSSQSLLPQIIDNKDGSKMVTMKFSVPSNVDPNKVNVSVKDRDLIVRVEDKVEKPDGISKFHYYQRTTLPENTQFDKLKCVQENNTITATAPLNLDWQRTARSIPVETKHQQGAIGQK